MDKGDGIYGDGPSFRWDYYNSFVIQPMLLDVLKACGDESQAVRAWDGQEFAAGRQEFAIDHAISN